VAPSSTLGPASRRTLADEVTDQLRQAILRGELLAGAHLPEESLAARLQVSRGPIRDALAALERDGLVTLSRHHGATVTELTRSDLEEVYSLRVALETLAARYVVRRAQRTDFQLIRAALDTFIANLNDSLTEQDAAHYDVQFHDAFYQAAHHERLYLSWSSIRLQVYRFLLRRNLANPDWRENMANGHSEILAVAQAGDEDQAAKIVSTHIQFAYMRILESFPTDNGGMEFMTPSISSEPRISVKAAGGAVRKTSARRSR
jgi:DNA-binding GntR family transcriptional regulator